MKLSLEGPQPLVMPKAQTPTVQLSGETVEVTLFLLDDYEQMGSIRVPMDVETARTLGLALVSAVRDR